MEVYFGWGGVTRYFLWVGGDGLRYILGGWTFFMGRWT